MGPPFGKTPRLGGRPPKGGVQHKYAIPDKKNQGGQGKEEEKNKKPPFFDIHH
jgi:hypothetical protein